MSEYNLKLDSYYYDSKRATTMVVIKVRNKRVMNTFAINEIFLNLHALENLHPIDLCILGILSNIKNHGEGQARRILDGFSMEKIQPLIEVDARRFSEKEEVLTLKLRHAGKKLQLSTSELYKNQQLIKALRYQDAIALGHSVSDLPGFIEDSITVEQKKYELTTLIMNCSFLGLLFLSSFTCLKSINLSFMNSNFHLEILLLPFIFLVQEKICRSNNLIIANSIILGGYTFYAAFIFYYGFIVALPYPEKSVITELYNDLLAEMLSKQFLYIVSLCIASCVFLQISFVKYRDKFNMLNDFNGVIVLFGFFWLAVFLLQICLGEVRYTVYEFGYSAAVLTIAVIITKSRLIDSSSQ